MEINPSIFKAYDIRGKYPGEINEEIIYKIGQAFVNYTGAKKILVARDTRLSSKDLCNSLISGAVSQGASVIDMGLSSTSCFYFTAGNHDVDAGLMATASHLEKDFNGLKMVLAKNVPLTIEQIKNLKDFVFDKEFDNVSQEAMIDRKDFNQFYIDKIRSFIKNKFKPLKVVMDASNGMAGLYLEKIFKGTELETTFLFTDLDGNFPNHEPNPKISANRQKLIEKILAEKADLGLMFDGDADRVYFLDRRGEVIDPNFVSALMAEYLIKQTGKKKILVEVRTSRLVEDYVKGAGGEVAVSVCWTIPMKLKMLADPEIIFGSETSGHYVFSELNCTDDGILAAITFLQAISLKKQSIDEIIKEFKQKYFIIEETNFKIKNQEQAKEILKALEEKYKNQKAEILKIDGLTVRFNEWWFNLRSSETEPVVRLNLEADNKELMEEKKEELSSLINELTNS